MKPALQYLFIRDFYVREHERLPGHDINGRKRLRKKRRSVILSWWKRLPTAKRNAFIAEAERAISRWNTTLDEGRAAVLSHIDEIQSKIDQYKASHRYSLKTPRIS